MALKAGESGENSTLLHEFESHLNRVMQSIEKSEARKKDKPGIDGSAAHEAVDPSKVSPIISDLLDLMESDLVEARRRMEDLAGHLAKSKFSPQFKTLEKQMDNFDIPAASDTLQKLGKEMQE